MIRAELRVYQRAACGKSRGMGHRRVAAFAVWGGILQDTAFPQTVDEDYRLLRQIFINNLNLFFATEAQERLWR